MAKSMKKRTTEADASYIDDAPRGSNRDLSEREDMWERTEGKGTPGGFKAMGNYSIQGMYNAKNRGDVANPNEPSSLTNKKYAMASGSLYGSAAKESDVTFTGKGSNSVKEAQNSR